MISKTDFQSFVPLNWHFKNLSTLLINKMSRHLYELCAKRVLSLAAVIFIECLYPNCTCQLCISAVKKTLLKIAHKTTPAYNFGLKLIFKNVTFRMKNVCKKCSKQFFYFFFIRMARDFQEKQQRLPGFPTNQKLFRFV